jgi:hypothetical protein
MGGRWFDGIASSNPTEGMDACLLCLLCVMVAASATGLSLVQRSPAGFVCVCVCVCLIVCDLETSTVRRPRPELDCCATEKIYLHDFRTKCTAKSVKFSHYFT